MIKKLRRRHLQIWILWAVLLPVGIVVAYVSVPKKVNQSLYQPPNPEKIIIAERATDKYILRVCVDSNVKSEKLYLEFINANGGQVPPILIYHFFYPNEKDIDKQILIGRVEDLESQTFPLQSPQNNWDLRNMRGYVATFLLYNFLENRVVDTVNMKAPANHKVDYSNF